MLNRHVQQFIMCQITFFLSIPTYGLFRSNILCKNTENSFALELEHRYTSLLIGILVSSFMVRFP